LIQREDTLPAQPKSGGGARLAQVGGNKVPRRAEARRRIAGSIGTGNKIGCGKCHIFNGVDSVVGELPARWIAPSIVRLGIGGRRTVVAAGPAALRRTPNISGHCLSLFI
jgi:hypothetical protein